MDVKSTGRTGYAKSIRELLYLSFWKPRRCLESENFTSSLPSFVRETTRFRSLVNYKRPRYLGFRCQITRLAASFSYFGGQLGGRIDDAGLCRVMELFIIDIASLTPIRL